MMAKSSKIKKNTITTLDTVPRDKNVISLLGKAKVFRDRKRKLKSDKVGRKTKYKEKL